MKREEIGGGEIEKEEEKPLTDEELARRIHPKMNASPRLGTWTNEEITNRENKNLAAAAGAGATRQQQQQQPAEQQERRVPRQPLPRTRAPPNKSTNSDDETRHQQIIDWSNNVTGETLCEEVPVPFNYITNRFMRSSDDKIIEEERYFAKVFVQPFGNDFHEQRGRSGHGSRRSRFQQRPVPDQRHRLRIGFVQIPRLQMPGRASRVRHPRDARHFSWFIHMRIHR